MNHHEDVPTVQPAGPSGDYPVARPARPWPEPPASGLGTFVRWLGRTLLVISLVVNLVLIFTFMPLTSRESKLGTTFHSGSATASDKIALIQVRGAIMEGLIDFASRQIKEAAQDDKVKAVVVIVNSPGGSVTASDRLHKQIMDLRDGKWDRQKNSKPVVVQMESVAASGGYYVAVPAQKIFAEPTTITGSIGVYSSLFEVSELAEKYGVRFNLIRRGELKASGSPFKKMTPEEREEFEEMIEHTFQRFQTIVKEGRGSKLRYGLREEIKVPSLTKPGETFVRRLADGGVYNADQAKEYGLIDQVGRLDDAIAEAKTLAGITDAKVIQYNRPYSLSDALFGLDSEARAKPLFLEDVPGFSRRLWYLTPGYELTGVQAPLRLFP